MGLWLTGCTAGNSLAGFAAGDGRLAVALPAVCEAFLEKVPEPVATAQTDAAIAAVRYADAFHDANGRIGAAADCSRDERALYTAKGPAK